MLVDPPTSFVLETELLTETGKTFAALVKGNDNSPEYAVDEYPEYWIG